jgi:phage shock protein PspC (stress-responsive transcriptional regulator)
MRIHCTHALVRMLYAYVQVAPCEGVVVAYLLVWLVQSSC